jgi:hypothetical protein
MTSITPMITMLPIGLFTGISTGLTGISAQLASKFFTQVAGGFFVVLGIIMTIILMNGNLAMA